MTVGEWLAGHFNDLPINQNAIAVACLSVGDAIEAGIENIRIVKADEVYEDSMGYADFVRGCKYALSTLYYSMSSTVTGGSKSEQRGNRRVSVGGYALTTRDREAFRAEADRLRRELGCEVEEDPLQFGGMFDATNLRRR